MKSYLLSISFKGGCYSLDPRSAWSLVPELRELGLRDGERAVVYVVLMYDTHSPYRNLEEDARRVEVLKALGVSRKEWGSYKGEGNDMLKAAAACYRSLNYDPLMDQLRVYNAK